MQKDALWVCQTLAGDRHAFDQLVRKYWESIYAQALLAIRNPADAEDLTNDVFLEAYLDLSSLRRLSSFHCWLRQIARHRCQDWLRQRKKTCLSLDEIGDGAELNLFRNSAEDQLLQQEKIDKTLKAIKSLPEKDRALMEGFYLEDLPYKTLQRRYHLSKAAVNMRLFKARQKVKQRVKELLAGIAAPSLRNMVKSLLMGGLEAMKISAVTEIATIAVIATLVLGGAGILVWHSRQPQQESPKSAVIQSVQEASADDRPLSNRPSGEASDEQGAGMQVDEAIAQPELSEEDLSPEEIEAFLAFLNEMGKSESSEEIASEPQEKRIYGLTRAEMEAKALELEREIRPKLTRINSLYAEIRNASQPGKELPAEMFEWRREADAEMKRLWAELRHFPSIMTTYVNYMLALGKGDPMAPGGWIYELQKPLPMRVDHIIVNALSFD